MAFPASLAALIAMLSVGCMPVTRRERPLKKRRHHTRIDSQVDVNFRLVRPICPGQDKFSKTGQMQREAVKLHSQRIARNPHFTAREPAV